MAKHIGSRIRQISALALAGDIKQLWSLRVLIYKMKILVVPISVVRARCDNTVDLTWSKAHSKCSKNTAVLSPEYGPFLHDPQQLEQSPECD